MHHACDARGAGAHLPARPKRQELVAAAVEFDATLLEPLRLELLGFVPVLGVAADGKGVDDDT